MKVYFTTINLYLGGPVVSDTMRTAVIIANDEEEARALLVKGIVNTLVAAPRFASQFAPDKTEAAAQRAASAEADACRFIPLETSSPGFVLL